MIKRKFGWIPQPKDHRDLVFKVPDIKLLPETNFSQYAPQPYDQLTLGSCTANGIAGVNEFLMKKQGLVPFTASRLAIYYKEREMEGTINKDAGAIIRDGIKVCNKFGVFPETEWAYDVKKFKLNPPKKCWDQALKHKFLEYYAVESTVNSVKASLTLGYPVVFGFQVYSNFMDIGTDGVMQMPRGTNEGGHCVWLLGNSDSKGWFICQNSWGVKWGDKGRFYMPYEYLKYCSDMWTLRLVENDK